MTRPAPAHRPRRWISWTIGGLALSLVGGVAFLFGIGTYVRAHTPTAGAQTGADRPIATEPVTVTMGKVVLRIPRNYFLVLPGHDIPGRPDGVEFVLLGLMPNFEPRTAANRAEFAHYHGFGRKLDILVTYKGYSRTGKDLFLTAYNAKARRPHTGEVYSVRGPVADAEFGYKSFITAGFEFLFHGAVDKPEDFIHCWPKQQVIPPGEKPLPYFPSCQRIILAGEDIVVEFEFSRDFLGNAHDIETQVINTLNRFRVSGPALERIQ